MTAFDYGIIGSGQGGVPLALHLAKTGNSVVLFERGAMGGCCVNVGCTPSKAFLASAHAAGRARRAAAIGVHADVRVDFDAVMERVRGLVREWREGVEKHFVDSTAQVVHGEASFDAPHILRVGDDTYDCSTIVVDTGATPVIPTIDGLDGTPYLTNETFFDLTELPKRTIVIGGGYIGLELGQGLARCGSDVHIINGAERVLTNEEPEVSAALQRSFAIDGITLHLTARTTKVAYHDGHFTLTFANGTTLDGDALLVATGRRPNIPAGLVERAGVALTKKGTIDVDEHLKTRVDGIYALGDVAGQPQFTHVSWEDFRRLRATLSGDMSRTRNDRVLGYAVYTDPQVGRAGMTHEAALAAGHDARCVTLPFDELARAIEWNETNGFFRLVVDAKSDAILGATFCGYEAGELIHVIIAHMEAGGTWRTLERSVHIHPTYAEGLPSLARLLL